VVVRRRTMVLLRAAGVSLSARRFGVHLRRTNTGSCVRSSCAPGIRGAASAASGSARTCAAAATSSDVLLLRQSSGLLPHRAKLPDRISPGARYCALIALDRKGPSPKRRPTSAAAFKTSRGHPVESVHAMGHTWHLPRSASGPGTRLPRRRALARCEL